MKFQSCGMLQNTSSPLSHLFLLHSVEYFICTTLFKNSFLLLKLSGQILFSAAQIPLPGGNSLLPASISSMPYRVTNHFQHSTVLQYRNGPMRFHEHHSGNRGKAPDSSSAWIASAWALVTRCKGKRGGSRYKRLLSFVKYLQFYIF